MTLTRSSDSRGYARGAASPARARPAASTRRGGRETPPPVLVRQMRGQVVESAHRGSIVEATVDGRLLRLVGDADRLVNLRSAVKPFGLVALVESGGVDAFELGGAELAVMAGSHSGEDLHVRTIQSVFRRAGLSQALLACGVEGAPLDALTAARLARDGEKPGPIRHMCSGQHAAMILLARLLDADPETYWLEDHPAQVAYRSAVARAFGVEPERLVLSTDACGIPTYAFPLRAVAGAYALLADPGSVPADDRRRTVAGPLARIRDAILAHPELVAGNRDRLDTSLMKALPGRLVSKGGAEGLRGVSILSGPRAGTAYTGPSGLALKVEDGGGFERAPWAAAVEALRQVGVLEGQPLRGLARYHRPRFADPHGRAAAESIPQFELVPVGELAG